MKKIIFIIFSFFIVCFVVILWIVSYKIAFKDKENNNKILEKTQIQRIQKKLKEKFKKENYFFVVGNSNFSSNFLNDFIRFLAKKETNNVKNIILISKTLDKEIKTYKSFWTTWNYCIGIPFKTPIPNCFFAKKFDFYNWKNTFKIFPVTKTFWSYNYENNIIYSLFKKYFWNNINFYELRLNPNLTEKQINELVSKLKKYNFENWNALFLAIWDFSRFKVDKIAVFKDLRTINILNQNKYVKNIEVECPSCLYLTKKLAKLEWKKYFNIFNREITKSKNIITNKTKRTSHIYWEFKRVLKDKVYKNKAFLDSYKQTKFKNWFLLYSKETTKKIYWAFFGDTHFTRWFTYKDSLKRKEKYFRCFREDYDIKKDFDKFKSRIFYWLDFIWVNLETSIAEEKECWFNNKEIIFRTLPKFLKDFKKIWINLVNLANNHSFDCNKKWLEATKKHLQENNIEYFWSPWNSKNSILKKEINWLKVAFVWINSIWVPLDVTEVEEQIKTLKVKWYLVILNIHWWKEYSSTISEKQKQLARTFVDAWANMIIWHHPHVIQPYEVYNWVPIFYSLWNFIFDQHIKRTLIWEWIFYELSENWVKFNIIKFERNPLNWEIKCETIK